jgi:transcriptional regulator with XRE-family HTH domain
VSDAAAQFRRLIEEIGNEHGHARGWKQHVAARLGVTPEHFSRLVSGARAPSMELLHRAANEYGAGLEAPRATDRYALLIEQLSEAHGRRHGWKGKVAKQLDVHPTYVAKIARGERTQVSARVIERAKERLGLRSEFFTAPEAQHYSQHVEGTPGDLDSELQALAVADAALASMDAAARTRALAWLVDRWGKL